MEKGPHYAKGREIRRLLIGDAAVKRIDETVYNDPMMREFGDYASEAVFGMLWGRPGLDLKTRALVCVVSDTAIHAWPELKIHARMARNMGWTEAELTEVLLHMGGYVGLPTVREGLLILRELFAEMRAEPAGA